MIFIRRLFIPVVIANNKGCFASFKKLHYFKYDPKLLLKNIVAIKRNALQYTYSTSFQDLPFQTDMSFNNSKIQQHIEFLLKEFNEAEEKLENGSHQVKDLKEIINSLQPLVVLKSEREKLIKQVEELDSFILDLKKQKDEELLGVAQQERETLSDHIHHCEMGMLECLLPESHEDEKDIILELSAGVGGQEAMLFTKDIFDMYCRFASYKRWDWDIIKFDATELGGLRCAHISINGLNTYKLLKFESGVHRVQRVPKTEKGGRIHTSTMTIAVLPQPTEIDVTLNPNEIHTVFKHSSGAGGQHVNKTESCVRLTHIATGIMVECQVSREQHRNRELALKSLRARLYQKKLNDTVREASSSRKLQVGSAARSDKVRTYNYVQDRITDHRIHKNMHNIEVFLLGGEPLDQLLSTLSDWSCVESLNEILMKYP